MIFFKVQRLEDWFILLNKVIVKQSHNT